jgi:CheY-like chemotaxis protein
MSKKIILIVDDDLNLKKKVPEETRFVLERIRETVRKCCDDVIEAYSYKGALAVLKKEKIDSAVVDIYIPFEDDAEIDGSIENGRQLIKELTERHIPIVAITNRAKMHEGSMIAKEYGILTFSKDLSELDSIKKAIQDTPIQNSRNRYCSYNKNKARCSQKFPFNDAKSVFIISSEENKSHASQLANKLNDARYKVEFWAENKSAAGEWIFCDKTCPRLYGNKIIIAEISDLNFNVTFEIGFSYGIGRLILFIHKKNKDFPLLKHLNDILRIEYKTIDEILVHFKKTTENSKKLLNSPSIYDTPAIFKNIANFAAPAKRKKNGKFIVSFDSYLLCENFDVLKKKGISPQNIDEVNLSDEEPDLKPIVERLISAKAILFLPHDEMEKQTGEYKVNNAVITFLAGLCVAQGVPVRIITKSYSNDFNQIKLSPGNRNAIANFMQ